MNAGTVNWQPAASKLPDCGINVLIAYPDDMDVPQVCEGYLEEIDDAGAPVWRDTTAWPVPGVYAGAEMPEPPKRAPLARPLKPPVWPVAEAKGL